MMAARSETPRTGPGRCRSCRARVFWAMTGSGRVMPVDADPHEAGDLVLYTEQIATFTGWESIDGVLNVRPANAEERTLALPMFAGLARSTPLRRSHFVTCPNAGQHRRPRRKGGA